MADRFTLADAAARSSELKQLNDWFSHLPGHQSLTVVYGQSGIGKTWLAHRFAYLFRDRFTSIYWIDGKTEDSAKETLAQLGDIDNNAPSSLEEENECLQKALKQLSMDDSLSLVIIDNFDVSRNPTGNDEDEKDIRYNLLRIIQSPILVLSRIRPVDVSHTIELTALKGIDQSSVGFTERSAQQPHFGTSPNTDIVHQHYLHFDDSAEKLIQEFNGFPLTISVVLAYLRKTLYSFSAYLDLYRRCLFEVSQICPKVCSSETLRLFTVLEITRKEVERQNPEATAFLQFVAYFDAFPLRYEDIKNVADGRKDIPTWLCTLAQSRQRFEQVVNLLFDFSLISEEFSKYVFPSLIHSWTNHCLNFQSEEFLFRIAEVHLLDHFRQVLACKLARKRWLIRQVQYLRQNPFAGYESVFKTELRPTRSFAMLSLLAGRKEVAVEAMLDVVNLLARDLSKDHEETMKATAQLAGWYHDLGRLDLAEQHYLRVSESYERLDIVNDFQIRPILNGLAQVYWKTNKVLEAEDVLKKSIRCNERARDMDNQLDVVCALFYLSEIKNARGEPNLALNMNKRGLLLYDKETIGTQTTAQKNKSEETTKPKRSGMQLTMIRTQCKMLHHLFTETPGSQISYLCEMIDLAKSCWNKIQMVFLTLSHMLMVTRNEDDARYLLRMQSFLRHSMASFCPTEGSSMCDGCNQPIDVSTGRARCRECFDIDLCDSCLQKHLVHEGSPLTCTEHQFFEVMTQDDNMSPFKSSNIGTEVSSWLLQLHQKYIRACYGKDFIYDKLPVNPAIRLLRFETFSQDSDIIELHLQSWNMDKLPVYIALSYTWDRVLQDQYHALHNIFKHDCSIRINGGHKRVSENLYEALILLRRKCKGYDLWFWIDALCINQDNPTERSIQVAQMSKIYTSAKVVFVWLGHEDDTTRPAVEIMQKLAVMPGNVRKQVEELQVDKFSRFPDLKQVLTLYGLETVIKTDNDWQYLYNFLQLRWFGRLWVVQEMSLAREAVGLLGDSAFPLKLVWQSLGKLLRFGLSAHIKALDGYTYGTARDMIALNESESGQSHEPLAKFSMSSHLGSFLPRFVEKPDYMSIFLCLCNLTNSFKCKEPQDHIFALKAVADHFSSMYGISTEPFDVDYNKTVTKVFEEVSKRMICSSQGLSFLCNIEPEHAARIVGLPSWVRDFHNESERHFSIACGMHRRGFHFSADSFFDLQNDDVQTVEFHQSELKTPGLCVGIISDTLPSPETLMLQDQTLETIDNVAKFILALPEQHPITGETREDTFWRTLLRNQDVNRREYPITATLEKRANLAAWLLELSFRAAKFEATKATKECSVEEIQTKTPLLQKLLQDSGLMSPEKFSAAIKRLLTKRSEVDKEQYQILLEESARTYYGAFDFHNQAKGLHYLPFMTNLGLVGFGVPNLQVGDSVWVLPTAAVPIILRPANDNRRLGGGNTVARLPPTPASTGQSSLLLHLGQKLSEHAPDRKYRLVGESYVHGIMHGDAVKLSGVHPQTVLLV